MSALLRTSNLLLAASAITMAFALWMVFFWVPTEANQGAIQRIVYLHVPVAWGSMLGVVLVAIASVAFLYTKKQVWDRIAVATAEAGVLFGGLMLLSGMIWARPVWGVWWTGEAKLTTALILFFIYIAYLLFRSYFPEGQQRQRLAAIIAIIGAIDTPIIYFAANLWSQAHPPAVVGPAATDTSSFASEFGMTLLMTTVAFTFLYAYIAYERFRQRRTEDEMSEAMRFADSLEGASA